MLCIFILHPHILLGIMFSDTFRRGTGFDVTFTNNESQNLSKFYFIHTESHAKESPVNCHTKDHSFNLVSFRLYHSHSFPHVSLSNPFIRIHTEGYGPSASFPELCILSISLTLLSSFQCSWYNN